MTRRLSRVVRVALAALPWACDGGDWTPSGPGTVVGSGTIATEARPVAGFTGLSVSHPAQVIVVWGGAESLEVSADDNVLPLVRSEVSGGRLFLGLAPHAGIASSREIVYRVTVRELADVEASGAAHLELRGVDAERLSLRLSGASAVTADGRCGLLELLLSGSSRVEASGLRSQRVMAVVSGASHALVRVEADLVATVTGASVLEYLGSPRVTSTVAGASSVRRVGP